MADEHDGGVIFYTGLGYGAEHIASFRNFLFDSSQQIKLVTRLLKLLLSTHQINKTIMSHGL